MSAVEERLAAMGYSVPDVVPPVAAYVPALRQGDWVFVSGQLPMRDGAMPATGKVGDGPGQVSPEAAKQISDLLGGVVALFRLQLVAAAEDVPELKILVELLRGTRVAPNGRLVTATGSVSGAVIEKTLAAKKKK